MYDRMPLSGTSFSTKILPDENRFPSVLAPAALAVTDRHGKRKSIQNSGFLCLVTEEGRGTLIRFYHQTLNGKPTFEQLLHDGLLLSWPKNAANVLVFEADDGSKWEITFDPVEGAKKFKDALEQRYKIQDTRPEKEKPRKISSPTNFEHLAHVGLTGSFISSKLENGCNDPAVRSVLEIVRMWHMKKPEGTVITKPPSLNLHVKSENPPPKPPRTFAEYSVPMKNGPKASMRVNTGQPKELPSPSKFYGELPGKSGNVAGGTKRAETDGGHIGSARMKAMINQWEGIKDKCT